MQFITNVFDTVKSMSATAIVTDAVVVLVFLMFCVSGARKGLYNKFMPLIVFVLSFVAAIFLSRMFTPEVTDRVFPQVSETVTKQIERFMNSFHLGGGEVSGLITLALKNVDMSKTAQALSRVVTEKLVHAALFIVIFLVALIVFKLISKLLGGIKELPLIKPLDRIGGFAFGALEGLAIMYAVTKLLDIFGVSFLRDCSPGTYLLSWLVDL